MEEASGAPPAAAPDVTPVVTPGPLSTYKDELPDVEFSPALSPAARREFQRSLERDLSRSLGGLPERSLGPRGRMVDVRDRFQHVVVQVRGQDGQLRTECLDDRRQLRELLQIEGSP